MLNSEGKLRIRAYTAGGALPVENALVKIRGAEEDNRLVAYTLVTDFDGLTPEVTLPAPSLEYSLSPDPSESPYSVYDVEISAPGYYTKRISGLTVFPGVSSIQLVNMIPYSGEGYEDYPRGNINMVIPNSNI
ncbi:MAG: carboxypeptidase regulatory-like domain-containing protein [Clostridia bacterium]|nr:carboxypeptidase regulatory-like domain-containing protein [Clostridia bacterium]